MKTSQLQKRIKLNEYSIRLCNAIERDRLSNPCYMLCEPPLLESYELGTCAEFSILFLHVCATADENLWLRDRDMFLNLVKTTSSPRLWAACPQLYRCRSVGDKGEGSFVQVQNRGDEMQFVPIQSLL